MEICGVNVCLQGVIAALNMLICFKYGGKLGIIFEKRWEN